MRTIRLIIRNQTGMHARAASQFVKVASRFEAEISVSRDDLTVNGKSIMGVLMLAAEPGAEIQVTAEGCDEAKALDALRQIVEEKFGEE